MINKHRKFDQYYDTSKAKVKLKELKILSSNYELSEECISSSTVFLHDGRTRPYIFPVGKHKDALFLIDTHPVPEDLGGNYNGLLLVTPDNSPRSCKLLVQWILKRLLKSGALEKELQSLAWLTPTTGWRLWVCSYVVINNKKNDSCLVYKNWSPNNLLWVFYQGFRSMTPQTSETWRSGYCFETSRSLHFFLIVKMEIEISNNLWICLKANNKFSRFPQRA